MTENRWPQDGSYGTPGVAEQTAVPAMPETDAAYDAAYPAPQGTPSRTETAKQEAGDVAHQATDSAQHVAETAKAEAANVAGEVKANAKDLLYQAKTDLTDQAGAQQQKVAQGLHSISGELRTMADASDQPGVATDLIRQAADRSASVASWLEGRDPGSLLDEVKTFARQRPGTFLMLAAGAGILAGRLTRSLTAGAPDSTGASLSGGTARPPISSVPGYVPDTGTAVPPPPVQMPAPDANTAGLSVAGAGTGAYAGTSAYSNERTGADSYSEDTYPPSPLAEEGTQRDQWASDPLAKDPLATDPLADDPYRDDPLRGGQR
ncbi:hypothetical protein JOE31_004195 [Arthrobacter sp. PvP023]|uniref:hypothetical protein n=1 Tax=Micrococcaceae TaxID=1268 RepID=UPI001AE544F4|nr:hypothetical protein [Arthrobacter sp. PvP023]MBP1137963.1 hypothetical protein [Arthrobacter sp. PvP023]